MNTHDVPRELRQIKNTDNQKRRHHDPARRNEEHEQRHTRHAQPGVLKHESIQCATAREHPGVVEHESIQRTSAREQTDNYLLLSKRDIDVANHGSDKHYSSISNDGMIINEDCNNGSANVSASTVNRVQDDNIVNATQGGSEAEELQCR